MKFAWIQPESILSHIDRDPWLLFSIPVQREEREKKQKEKCSPLYIPLPCLSLFRSIGLFPFLCIIFIRGWVISHLTWYNPVVIVNYATYRISRWWYSFPHDSSYLCFLFSAFPLLFHTHRNKIFPHTLSPFAASENSIFLIVLFKWNLQIKEKYKKIFKMCILHNM